MEQYAFRIQFQTSPTAGQTFNFSVPQEIGRVNIHIFVDEYEMDVRECDDPPCYEAIHLPERLAGQTLRVRAVGERGEIDFEHAISAQTDQAGGTMGASSSSE